MTEGRDVDETILDLANSLVRKTNDLPKISGRQTIFYLDEIPRLFVTLFEFITSEVIQDDVHDVNNPEDLARNLQKIIDTLEEIMNVQMSHITGLGLVTLNRRQLYDMLQVFNGLISCVKEDPVIGGEISNENVGDNRDSDITRLNEIPSARVETDLRELERQERTANRRPTQNFRQQNASSQKQHQEVIGTVSTKQASNRKVNYAKGQGRETSIHKKTLSNIGNSVRGNGLGKRNNIRKGNYDRNPSIGDVFTSSARCSKPLSSMGSSLRGNGVKKSPVNNDVFTSSVRRRKHSVVSTKIKRHGSSSPGAVKSLKRSTRVKRGDLSPQTVSMCSSLKLLEEFDYLKRRHKEIQIEIQEHMTRVQELHDEELRIEHVLIHVQQLAGSTKKRVRHAYRK